MFRWIEGEKRIFKLKLNKWMMFQRITVNNLRIKIQNFSLSKDKVLFSNERKLFCFSESEKESANLNILVEQKSSMFSGGTCGISRCIGTPLISIRVPPCTIKMGHHQPFTCSLSVTSRAFYTYCIKLAWNLQLLKASNKRTPWTRTQTNPGCHRSWGFKLMNLYFPPETVVPDPSKDTNEF